MITDKMLTKLWDVMFDAVYVLVYIPYMNTRFEKLLSELKRVGLYDSKKLHITYTTNSTFSESIFRSRAIPMNNITVHAVGIMNSSLEHYRVIKSSQQLGLNRICIFEDDVVFLKNLEEIYNILTNLPTDYDICLGDSSFGKSDNEFEHRKDVARNNKINKYWADTAGTAPIWLASCYIANQPAMEHMWKSQEVRLEVPDHYTYKGGNLKRCFAIKNICIQRELDGSLTPKNILHRRYVKQGLNLEDYNL